MSRFIALSLKCLLRPNGTSVVYCEHLDKLFVALHNTTSVQSFTSSTALLALKRDKEGVGTIQDILFVTID